MSRTAKILSVIILVILVGAGLVFWKFWPKKNNSSPTTTASKAGLFGTMLAFDINDAAMGTPGMLDAIRQKGWTEFRKDDSAYQNLLSNLEKLIQDHTKLVETTGFSIDREAVAGYFTWNVIEPQKGQFDWELTDIYVKGASNAGVKISAVIQPFAGWDQKDTEPEKAMADFAYYDYKAGPPSDLAEYQNFLTKMVERYKDKVAVWEIDNEPENPGSGYQNNPEGYFDLVKITSEMIKKADPEAKVTNGGAMPIVGAPESDSYKAYWTKFFALGGNQYIDYFNVHYNNERSPGATLDPATFQEELTFFNNFMEKNGGKKPLYLTEFGIYSGTPSDQLVGQLLQGQSPTANQPVPPIQGGNQGVQTPTKPSSTSQSFPNESQDAQAALYFKDSVLASANGANAVFVDLIGKEGDIIGSSALFNPEGQPRLFLATLKAINQKLAGFSKSEKIADGQYKFSVDGKTIYALWSGILPSEISGKAKVTDLKGKEQTLDMSAIKLNPDQPVLIE